MLVPRLLPLALLLAAGCVDPAALAGEDPSSLATTPAPWGEDDCGKVRRRADGALFFPTASADSPPSSWEARVASRAQARWDAAYERPPCVVDAPRLEGAPAPAQPWYGPALAPGQRDEITLTLVNRHLPENATWTVRVALHGGLRLAGGFEAWEAPVRRGETTLRYVVEATGEAGLAGVELTGAIEGVAAEAWFGGWSHLVVEAVAEPHVVP